MRFLKRRCCTYPDQGYLRDRSKLTGLNSISQIKSLKLLTIDLGQNVYEITYFGDPKIFSLKLSNNNIFENIIIENKGILSLNS